MEREKLVERATNHGYSRMYSVYDLQSYYIELCLIQKWLRERPKKAIHVSVTTSPTGNVLQIGRLIFRKPFKSYLKGLELGLNSSFDSLEDKPIFRIENKKAGTNIQF